MDKALAFFNRSDCVSTRSTSAACARARRSRRQDHAGQRPGLPLLHGEQTGGEFLKNANDLGPSFDKLLDRTGLDLSAGLSAGAHSGKRQVPRAEGAREEPAYRVSARTGYYEPKKHDQVTPLERRLAASSAIAAAVPQTEIPAWVCAAVSRPRTERPECRSSWRCPATGSSRSTRVRHECRPLRLRGRRGAVRRATTSINRSGSSSPRSARSSRQARHQVLRAARPPPGRVLAAHPGPGQRDGSDRADRHGRCGARREAGTPSRRRRFSVARAGTWVMVKAKPRQTRIRVRNTPSRSRAKRSFPPRSLPSTAGRPARSA